MKLFSLLSACIVSIIGYGSATIYAQSQLPSSPGATAHQRIVPLAPKELLNLLPHTPDQWQMKQSTAKNFAMDWVTSQAQREFQYTPPAAPDAAPNPTQVLHITITDTGYYAGLMGDFDNFQAGSKGEAESLVVKGFPARHVMVGKTTERLRLLIKQRYVVQIDVQNEPVGSAQKWVEILDFAKLASLPVDGEMNLPHPLILVKIDELNPQNNSTAKAFWSAPDEGSTATRRH